MKKITKITGIKSVDFIIEASGRGVVNWNGNTPLWSREANKVIKNHTMPKLRGYTSMSGKFKENGFEFPKDAHQVNFQETPMYISQNCIRHFLFRQNSHDLHFATKENAAEILVSLVGLLRGYVIPACEYSRTSPLLISDFVDQLGNGNYEQFTQAGTRDSTSLFSKTTFGKTQYLATGSINIENLQFISLDRKFGKTALEIKTNEGSQIAKNIEIFLQSLTTKKLKPVATFHENYVRRGTIFNEGENGILLNNDAIEILVDYTLDLVRNLSIASQGKGNMWVTSVVVDYNDSDMPVRVEQDIENISNVPSSKYAVYFEAV